jgi:cyclophilin family peptidyl-prolyl cis-trans isomerase
MEVGRFLDRVAQSDRDQFVRNVAGKDLEWTLELWSLPAVPDPLPRAERIELPTQLVDLPRSDAPLFARVTTNRGAMLFELFPRETPFHVYNFLTLAERGHYDGLEFHRVVPDFVIQGGDVRGDGNGGTTWCERPLPAEFTPRKYVRGSLGMPRNEDPNSGGSQIFVTHRATPHLDGRYTIFGELREGFEVLDRIEVGDRILEVGRAER